MLNTESKKSLKHQNSVVRATFKLENIEKYLTTTWIVPKTEDEFLAQFIAYLHELSQTSDERICQHVRQNGEGDIEFIDFQPSDLFCRIKKLLDTILMEIQNKSEVILKFRQPYACVSIEDGNESIITRIHGSYKPGELLSQFMRKFGYKILVKSDDIYVIWTINNPQNKCKLNPIPLDDAPNYMYDIYVNQKLTDFEIHVDNKIFRTHKVVLYGKGGDYFKSLFETKFKEAEHSSLTLSEFSSDTINLYLNFLCGDSRALSDTTMNKNV